MRGKALKNTHLVASRHIKRESVFHFRLTCVAQKRLCLSSLISVQRKRWGRKLANASKTWKKDDGKKTTKMPRNRHKMWQALGLSSLSLRFDTILPPFALAFVLERSTKNEGGDSPLPISFPPPPPHLFRLLIRRLKVRNMTWNHILIIRYPLSKLNAGPKIDSRGTPQVTVWVIEMLFSTIHCCYLSDAWWINPFTAKVLHGVLQGDSNFWDCGRNPMMWPFKWKVSAFTVLLVFQNFTELNLEIWSKFAFGSIWQWKG